MSEWSTVTLADIADIRFSNVDKKSLAGEKSVRLCNYMDTYSNNYITADLPFMEATATAPEMERFKVEKGDNIITKDSETPDDIGIPAVVIDDIPNLICGYHLALIKPKRDKVDPIYLSKQLGSKQSAIYFSRLANGSTRYGLSSSAIALIKIPLAPFVEQRRIAEVLSTLDKAIEKTEALIAKYQQIKAGLMHDLFTRGVTADGKLRPSREQAPELYQETPIGWIPKAWEARLIVSAVSQKQNAIVDGPFGSNLKTIHYRTSGIPVIQSGYVTSGIFQADEYFYVTESHFQTQSRSRVNPGDIVIAKIGAQAGMCAVLPDDHSFGILAGNSLKITADNSILHRDWLVAYLQRLYVVTGMRGIRTETAQPAISIGRLKKLFVPVPEVNEQIYGTKIISALNQNLTKQTVYLAKFYQQKSGLMHDLLTGKVRVKTYGQENTK